MAILELYCILHIFIKNYKNITFMTKKQVIKIDQAVLESTS